MSLLTWSERPGEVAESHSDPARQIPKNETRFAGWMGRTYSRIIILWLHYGILCIHLSLSPAIRGGEKCDGYNEYFHAVA